MRYILAALILIVAACSTNYPTNWTPLSPPQPEYHDWLIQTEQCSGLGGYLDSLTFRVVQPEDWPIERLGGYFVPPDTIFLDEFHTTTGQVVRHEILHYLVYRGGIAPASAHPDEYFRVRCGGTVSQNY